MSFLIGIFMLINFALEGCILIVTVMSGDKETFYNINCHTNICILERKYMVHVKSFSSFKGKQRSYATKSQGQLYKCIQIYVSVFV